MTLPLSRCAGCASAVGGFALPSECGRANPLTACPEPAQTTEPCGSTGEASGAAPRPGSPAPGSPGSVNRLRAVRRDSAPSSHPPADGCTEPCRRTLWSCCSWEQRAERLGTVPLDRDAGGGDFPGLPLDPGVSPGMRGPSPGAGERPSGYLSAGDSPLYR